MEQEDIKKQRPEIEIGCKLLNKLVIGAIIWEHYLTQVLKKSCFLIG